MNPRNPHLTRLALALAVTALVVPAARASTATVQSLQAISGTSPATQPCELGVEYEPQIAVNPRDPDNIVAMWIEGVAQALVAGVSKDGGRTWTQVLVPNASGCSGVLREDPRLAFDADGKTLYLASLCDLACTEDPTGSDLVVVRRSFDGGLTWDTQKPPKVVAGHIPDGCDDECHNAEVSITADPREPGHAYLVWTKHNAVVDPLAPFPLKNTPPWPAYFSRTTDGGDRWSPPVVIYQPDNAFPLLHDIRVLPDGTLLDIFVEYLADASGTHQMALHLRSDGSKLSDAREIAVVPDIKATNPATALPAHDTAAKPAFDVARNGTAYVAWQDIESTTSSSIRIAKSRDRGMSWTELTPVITESSDYNGQAFQPTLAVGQDGTVGVTYFDFRSDQPGDEKLDTHVWFAHSHDGGTSWRETHVAGPFDLQTAQLGEVDGLAATPDGFVADFVLAEPAATEPPQDIFFAHLLVPERGAKTTGGGWLSDGKGGKINFGFHVDEFASGAAGDLELNDTAARVKIHLTDATSLGPVGVGCGSVKAGESSLELRGRGTYNGSGASFRACVQDGGDPGRGADRFYLACTAGCVYTTGSPAPDDLIDGGNIQVGETATASAGSQPTTLILDPLLLSEALVGEAQTFTVSVYDQNQEPLAHASVTLTATASGGSVQTLTALTDATGTATFVAPALAGTVEYKAGAGAAESNTIELSPLLG